jgi:hypothetical protein
MLDDTAKALAQGKNFAAFTTLLPGGQPQTQMMWVDADDEHVLINTRCTARSSRTSSATRG